MASPSPDETQSHSYRLKSAVYSHALSPRAEQEEQQTPQLKNFGDTENIFSTVKECIHYQRGDSAEAASRCNRINGEKNPNSILADSNSCVTNTPAKRDEKNKINIVERW